MHHVDTGADGWRHQPQRLPKAIPYGEGTRDATEVEVEVAVRQIYADYPEILSALGLLP